MVIFETIPHTETNEIGSTAAAPITTGTKVIGAQHTANTRVSMINSMIK